MEVRVLFSMMLMEENFATSQLGLGILRHSRTLCDRNCLN